MSTTPKSPPKKSVVVCFCAKDQDGQAELVAHLATVSAALSWWSVAEVSAGQAVRAEFQRVVAGADAALLVLSSDFFAALNAPGSTDTNALPLAAQVELLRHQQPRGLQLIPLVWRDCEWREVEWLAALQPLPIAGTAIRALDAAGRDRAFAEIARRLGGKRAPQTSVLTRRSSLIVWVVLVCLFVGGTIGAAIRVLRSASSDPVTAPPAAAVRDLSVRVDHSVAPTLWRVEGLIRDHHNEPLQGVTVSLPEHNATTQTNALGHFGLAIAAEQSELVLLRAELRAAPGSKRKYKPQEQNVNLGSTKLDIVLEEGR